MQRFIHDELRVLSDGATGDASVTQSADDADGKQERGRFQTNQIATSGKFLKLAARMLKKISM